VGVPRLGILENVKITLENRQFTDKIKRIDRHVAIPRSTPVKMFPAPIPTNVEVPNKARDFVFFSDG
jgi:hypothetical protein